MAGESARDVARRRREKAERLGRQAAAWERGAEGEAATAAALSALPDGWVVLHDIAWPGRPYANIDHVVVGPAGVFVIDSKNWSGDITIRDGVLRQNGRVRASGVDGVLQAAREVGLLAQPIDQRSLHGVLCFIRDEQLAGKLGKALVCTQSNVVELLTSQPRTLALDEVSRIASALATQTAPATAPRYPKPRITSGSRKAATPSRRPRRKGRSLGPDLARLAVGLTAAVVLVAKPEIVTSAANAFSHMIVGIVSPEAPEPSQSPSPKHPHRSHS